MRKRAARMAIGVAVVLALLLVMPGAGSAADSKDSGLQKAMKSFVQAMVRKDSNGILAAFSQRNPWRFVGYEIGTGRPLESKMVSFAQMSRDFRARKGWYHFFFDDPNGYTFRINFGKGEVWKRRGTTYARSSGDRSVRHYIKWRQEGGKWVIAEIGDTSP